MQGFVALVGFGANFLNSTTPLCSTCHHYTGSIRILITGIWKCIGFDSFACGFRFWSNFFLVFRFWIIFSTVLRFLINPNAYPPPQASTTQIIRAMSHREWVTLRRIVLPYFILHAEIACSQRLKTTVHHVSSYILYAGRQLSVFFFHIWNRSQKYQY